MILYQKIIKQYKDFTIKFTALEEDIPISDMFDCSREQICDIYQKIDNGSLVWFCAKVSLLFDMEEIASNYLGGCLYESYDEFSKGDCFTVNGRQVGYIDDMISIVISEGREYLKEKRDMINELKLKN